MRVKLTSFLFALAAVVFTGCDKDDDDKTPACSTNWSAELNDEINAVTSAATAYGNDPTTANCNAYKGSLQDYIDALRPYGNCNALTGQNRTEFERTLNDAEESLVDLCQ